MTKSEFLKYFSGLEDKTNRQSAEFYLNTKGIYYHYKIAKFINVNFENVQPKISWFSVTSVLKYDKRLRYKIYVYLATFEEYLKAYLSNEYGEKPKQNFWLNHSKDKKQFIKNRLENNEILFDILEDVDLGFLINQIINLPNIDKNRIFDNQKDLGMNLKALKELRNAVSHHKFLLSYSFKKCNVDNEINNTLKHNIKNLRQLLPRSYRFGENGLGGITKEINNCKYEFDKINKKNIVRIEDKYIIKI